MKRLINSVAFALLFSVSFHVSSEVPADAPSGVELDKTLELFKGWSRRKAFPDSVSFAYYMAYSFHTLGANIEPATRTRLVQFVSTSQQKDGGFASNPTYGTRSNVIYTYYALETLRLLGTLDAIDRDRTTAFISSLVQGDGSIKPAIAEDARATLASTYYGAASLHMLDKLDVLDNSKTTAFVLNHRTSDDGFGMMAKGAATKQRIRRPPSPVAHGAAPRRRPTPAVDPRRLPSLGIRGPSPVASRAPQPTASPPLPPGPCYPRRRPPPQPGPCRVPDSGLKLGAASRHARAGSVPARARARLLGGVPGRCRLGPGP